MLAVKRKAEAPPEWNFASLSSLLAGDLPRVEFLLDEYVAPHSRHFPNIIDHLSAYRGKRLRPVLTILTAHALQLGVRPNHYAAAAVVELIHTATLVHDDVLDEAALRRKTATLHSRFGNKVSILLGDLLFSTAYHQASRTGDAKIGELIGSATNRVVAGEMLQTLRSQSWEVSEDDYYSMIDGKTAALTECACQLAGHISHAKPETVAKMAEYGRELGLAFQISDDLLDIVGEQGTVGKTLGTDLLQKKATLPIIRFFQQANPSQRAIFDAHYTDRPAVSELFGNIGIIDQIQESIDRHIRDAKSCLTVLPVSPYRAALENIADWCRVRVR